METRMKIIILITVVESLALALLVAYSYHKRGALRLRSAIAKPSVFIPNLLEPNPSLPPLDSGHWSFINTWQVQAQHDDRPPMNGFVPPRSGAIPAVRRAFARQRHQLMYKKWSKERHD
jgi:hypothetical protein